jgi:ribose transport system substrate-binding protein
MRKRVLLAAACTLVILAAPGAWADDVVAVAKAQVAAATGRADVWRGPTAGPKAAQGKTVIFVAGDMKNGGILGVSQGVQEAGKAIGWQVRVLDGQGTVSGRTAALDQALTLKPDGIIVGGFDTNEQKVGFKQAADARIPLVGWHSGPKPGPDPAAGLFANVTSVSADVAETAADLAVAASNGHAGVVIFTDSQYQIALFKARAMEAVVKKCPGCTVLSFEDSPIAEASQRMPQLTTSLLQRFGSRWTYSLAINDVYFDFMPPSLSAAGIPGDGAPHAISAGDGSESAYQRIRAAQYQMATVPEPLNMQGWQLVDELNRAFAEQPWSGFVPLIHLVTAENIAYDGGPNNVFDPDNHYREYYEAIWGK